MRAKAILFTLAAFVLIAALSVGIVAVGRAIAVRAGVTADLPSLLEGASTVFSGLALVGLIATIVLQTNAIQQGTSAAVANRQMDVDRLFVDRPALRPYFLEGRAIAPEDALYNEVMATAVLIANFFDSYFLERQASRQLYKNAQWDAYLNAHVAGSPALRTLVIERATWYSDDFLRRVRVIAADHPAS